MDVRITPMSEVRRNSPLERAWAETAVEDPFTTLAETQRQLGIDQGPLADELGALLH